MENFFQKNNPRRQKLIKPLDGQSVKEEKTGQSEVLSSGDHLKLKSLAKEAIQQSLAKNKKQVAGRNQSEKLQTRLENLNDLLTQKFINKELDLSQSKSEIINYIEDLEKSESQKVNSGFKMLPHKIENYVKDLDHLKEMLLTALQLELSTIPPYLCGLYSIKDGSNIEAAMLIRSVVVEEMLHMVLVSNILNAITDSSQLKKGEKLFNVEKIIPNYPTALPGNIEPEMPNGELFKVHLYKFSREALDEFTTIERPCAPDEELKDNETFDSIGQFYQAIRYGLKRLNENTPGGIFTGDPERQVTPEHYYGSGGKIIKVTTYEEAEEAIAEIVGQGEGIDGTIEANQPMFGEGIEYAHFFKFQEINYGRMYAANDTNFKKPVLSIPTGQPFNVSWSSVHNMKADPKMADYEKKPELYQKAVDFNKTYVQLLECINDAVSGNPDILVHGISKMYELKYKAVELMNIPLGNGEYAGPTFEYVKP